MKWQQALNMLYGQAAGPCEVGEMVLQESHKGQEKNLHLGWKNTVIVRAVSKLASKDLGVLVHSKLNINQQYALAAQKPTGLVACNSNSSQQVER